MIELTDAELITYWEAQARHYKDLSLRLHEQLLAAKQQPETHSGRGLHPDPVGNKVAARIDRQRENTDTRILDWSWESQCALWRSRAIHQAERASRFKALAEALQKGDRITLSDEEPRL